LNIPVIKLTAIADIQKFIHRFVVYNYIKGKLSKPDTSKFIQDIQI